MFMKQLKIYLNRGNERSILVKKNVIASLFNKGIAILISLLLIPTTINYLNPTQYGIWLTISSIVGWISYFDIGLVHGFKNKFAEAKANGNLKLACQYVSTTYAALIIIFGCIIVISECINYYIDWAGFLNIDESYNSLLTSVCSVLFLFVGLQLILGIISALLMADQHSALAAIITTIGQGVALICIYILTFFSDKSMLYISFALSGIPCIVLLLATILLFSYKYKQYIPSFKYVNFSLTKDIVVLGGKFFLIQLSMLIIFQITNIILSRIEGPEAVTQYNVLYKYFSIIQMVLNIILSPFWIAYTDAYVKQDFVWMQKVYRKLNHIYIYTIIVGFIMLLIYPFVFNLWLSQSVSITWDIAISMYLYVLILSYSNMLMIIINGIGKIFIQMIIYVIFAFISIPLCYVFCTYWGISGILAALAFVYLIQALFAKVQLSKILKKEANGIWNK